MEGGEERVRELRVRVDKEGNLNWNRGRKGEEDWKERKEG